MQKGTTIQTMPIDVRDQVRRLVDWMSEGVYEKEQLAAMALLCAVAGENIFLLGPPGTAKSLVARRLKGVFRDARSFDYLMSRFSTPDEIFGPISISKLKENDSYERLTAGYLPSADVVFLDEIWKAGPSIQNTLLTAINEHIYRNGTTTMRLPMKVLIAASNELPAKNEGLEALWDRFLVRMVSNCIEDDDNFERMLLSLETTFPVLDKGLQLTDDKYRQWHETSLRTGVPPEIMNIIKSLRREIIRLAGNEPEDGKKLDYYVSDRRWKKAFRLMQASACLNGRSVLDSSDIILLIHCLWNEPDCRDEINRLVSNALWQVTTEENYAINDTLRHLVSPEAESEKSTALSPVPETAYTELYSSYYAIEDFRNGTGLIAKWDYKRLSYIDETEAIEFVDNAMRMPVVQIMKNNSILNLNMSSTMGKPRKVKLLKCSGGVVLDGTPYSLTRRGTQPGSKESVVSLPRRRELSSLKKRYERCLKTWEKCRARIIDETSANIFISTTDSAMIQEQMTTLTTLLTETRIRLNNVTKILA